MTSFVKAQQQLVICQSRYQRRIFIFGVRGYFNFGVLLEGSRRRMSYKLFARDIHWTSCSNSYTYYFILNSLDIRNKKSCSLFPLSRKCQRWRYLKTLLLHIYWVPCATAWFANVKNWLWVWHLYFLRHQTACYIVSDRRDVLSVKSLINLSYFIFLAKAYSIYRIARLCSMPPPRNNLLRILLVLYINFQLLENKRKEQGRWWNGCRFCTFDLR